MAEKLLKVTKRKIVPKNGANGSAGAPCTPPRTIRRARPTNTDNSYGHHNNVGDIMDVVPDEESLLSELDRLYAYGKITR